MATGSNIQGGRGREVTNLAPQVDLRTGDAEVWDRARRVFDQYADAARPNLIRRAQQRGMEEGLAVAAGEAMPRRGLLFGGDVAEARTQALGAAYRSKTFNDFDAQNAELRTTFRYDPEGYQAAAREKVSAFIQGAPPEFAVEIETYANNKVADAFGSIAQQRAVRDEQEVTQGLGVRIATLDETLIALASNGEMSGEAWNAAMAERAELQTLRQDNPAILYSPEQRALDDEKLLDSATSAITTREAISAYQAAGRGQAGYAAASRFLNDEVLQGDAYKDMPPARRQRVYRDSLAQVRDFAAADREEARAAAEAERAQRAERRELVGDYRLRILLGEATEAEVLADETLTEADKAGLVSSARAQQRRERADARSLAALEAANVRGIYQGFRDQADAGRLETSELADALNAGLITPGQAATLRDLNDRQLKPIVDNVLAPVRDAARAPGRSVRGNAAQMVIAEEAALRFVRQNPDATLEQQLAAGRAIADRVFGGAGRGRPANAQTAQSGQTAALTALSNERTQRAQQGRPMSMAEYNRRRTEILHGQ